MVFLLARPCISGSGAEGLEGIMLFSFLCHGQGVSTQIIQCNKGKLLLILIFSVFSVFSVNCKRSYISFFPYISFFVRILISRKKMGWKLP